MEGGTLGLQGRQGELGAGLGVLCGVRPRLELLLRRRWGGGLWKARGMVTWYPQSPAGLAQRGQVFVTKYLLREWRRKIKTW